MNAHIFQAGARQVAAVVVAASILAMSATSVQAGATYHNVPGPACQPVDNQAGDRLQRSHVRLYNPRTSGRDMWVICPVQRVQEDVAATADPSRGYVNIYFGEESDPNASVPCVIREFRYNTQHVAGQGPTGILQFANTTASRNGAAAPTVDDASFNLSTDDLSNFNYYTVTCQLKMGTGINSIDFRQQ